MPLITKPQNAETDAQELLDRVWKVGGRIKVPIDPYLIADRLGIDTYLANLADASGIFRIRPGQDPEIYVNATDHRNRQRFTCAHELGHYYQIVQGGDAVQASDSTVEIVERRDLISAQGTDAAEIYANQFAASLLMPKDKVKEMWNRGFTAVTLGYEFGVSADAMTFRLKNLKLLK